MNYYNLQKNAFPACEEMRGSIPIADQNGGPVFCPKPRRAGVLMNLPIRPVKWHLGQQGEGSDSKAGAELLDIVLKRESYGEEFANQIPSSPPYFCGSPPVRASNPLIQDARFGDEVSTISSPSGLLSPSSASRKAGCARMKFGLKPAAVRVEGFDCLSRDCQNSGIPAVA
ncbi:hypothetical protein AAZX31_08G354800 [Glycine max]|uniref:Uncharacterized protein n=2 Tax=Glycine subgen. Soja TaxID=1462606 RepID=I1KZL6_SOYBN|nr:uncharacterized protein LOC100814060 [Glycine max]XP_028246545.1 uncharacterized protein LOC114423844 [Glycine soja]KAG5002432.1 hypothetical protein JHK87_023504 [Glycine soja]KAG5017887.1 hypothetical protein JHK85_024023 [Glycine max]KAG5138826.1 hypothetical protein JHK82_023557 [Glycine max]KAH1054827.1 hypothetical protein GYH30_023545 [Glycine max]KAH1240023.1 hypothetical protein GmHk_08G024321 [Glycine max]|eukprot:XP_003532341.1 uncharacterized protein LOC100814060 [Glycine max]